jgi:hypothetical protein
VYKRQMLNFHSGNGFLKLLAGLWIVQNAFMIISTAYRNNLYINEYSLTYKRIGVYIWLLLVLIGLITTFIKVLKAKSNWYLFRTNGWLFYGVLLISCFINWDLLVTDFNINRAEQKHKSLDVNYLVTLSEKNIPQLLSLSDSLKVQTSYEDEWGRSYDYNYYYDNYKPALHYKLYCFLDEMQKREWQSICVEKERVFKKIKSIKKDVKQINLQSYYLKTLRSLAPLDELQILNFSSNRLEDAGELKLFPQLQVLDLSSNYLDTINHFPYMKNLTILTLTNNSIADISALKNAPELVSLDLSGNMYMDIKTLPELKKLNSLSINGNNILDYNPLIRLPELHRLTISGAFASRSVDFPLLPQLKELRLQNMNLTQNDTYVFQNLESFENLEYLNLADNKIDNLYSVITFKSIKTENKTELILPLFNNLKTLDVSRNTISTLYPLTAYPDIEVLYIGGNPLKDLSPLLQLNHLKVLSINDCGLSTVELLENLENLEVLDISGNPYMNYKSLYKLKNLKQLRIGAATKQTVEQLKKALPNTEIIAYTPNNNSRK